MRLYKYIVQTLGNKVTSLITDDPNPKLSEGDLFGVKGETSGPVHELKVLKNTKPFSNVTDMEIRVGAALSSIRLYDFTVVDQTPIETTANKNTVYALINSEGEILDRRGKAAKGNARIFGRKSDASNSLNKMYRPEGVSIKLFKLVEV